MRKILNGHLLVGLGFILCVLGMPAAMAAGNAYADAVLEALAKKGLLTDQEVHDIKLNAREAEREEQAAVARTTPKSEPSIVQASVPVADNPTPESSGVLAKAAESVNKHISPESGFPSFRVWGRLQPRYTYIPSTQGREGVNSFTMRRARIGLKGYLAKKMPFRYQYEASNEVAGLSNATNLLDAWVGFEHFRDQVGDIIVGQQFVPGYTRAPQLTASVERKFSEVLYPGEAGRARGITLRRGDNGRPETTSQGLFNNHLLYGVGLFNGPDLSKNNDNNELLFAGTIGWRPTGQSVWPDEYALKKRGFNYGLNAAYAHSRDTRTLDTGVQAALGNRVELDDDWYSLFADVEYEHWFGWASWNRFDSDPRDGVVIDADGRVKSSLSSSAWTIGGSRTFPISGSQNIQGWALALQYQHVDNEHPSRTRFFGNLNGNSTELRARGMNDGSAYHAIVTFILNPNARILNEYTYYSGTGIGGDKDYGSLVSQLQIDF